MTKPLRQQLEVKDGNTITASRKSRSATVHSRRRRRLVRIRFFLFGFRRSIPLVYLLLPCDNPKNPSSSQETRTLAIEVRLSPFLFLSRVSTPPPPVLLRLSSSDRLGFAIVRYLVRIR